MEEILAMEHITKTYPGVKALDDVSISFIQGEVHAVMGENGAGKSTLMKILNGMIQADSGDIRFHGEKVAIRNPRDARALGIAMIHQELNPIKDLTVAENMFVGRYPQKGCFVDWSTMYDECRKLFEHWKVDFDPKLTVSELDCGQAKTTVYGPHYHDMFANELLEFYRCVTTHDTPKCDVFDAAEDVKLYIDVAKMMK